MNNLTNALAFLSDKDLIQLQKDICTEQMRRLQPESEPIAKDCEKTGLSLHDQVRYQRLQATTQKKLTTKNKKANKQLTE